MFGLNKKTPEETAQDDKMKKFKDEFIIHKNDTQKDLEFRIDGVKGTRGSSGYQFVGYNTLQEFYRGDQWDADEPPGASQRTDNYCSNIVDNFSSLLFDAPVEIHCPSLDNTDEVLELKAEIKEKLLEKVYEENNANEIVLPECSKTGSLFGDSFLKGPLLDKNGSEDKKDWKIVFYNVENPANIRPIFLDENYTKLYGFIDTTSVSPMWLEKHMSDKLAAKGLTVKDILKKYSYQKMGRKTTLDLNSQVSYQRMIKRHEYWTANAMGVFIEDELVDYYEHNWGFIPLEYIKNIHSPNHPYGKSDIEDAIDPQLFYTRTNNDLANALKFLSTITLSGKNLDGMEVLVHGMSKIFNIPEDGELTSLPRSGDPYASGNFVSGRRQAILDVTGLAESLLATTQAGNVSGRALSVAMQSVIRKLNPRIKRYEKSLKSLNANILKLMEMYWPETREIIVGDYSSKVSIISTLLRNIIDELNKLQSGVQSLTTTQRNLGISQPKMEQKVIKRDLMDPVLGPQIARQPGLLPVMQDPNGQQGTPGSNDQQNLPSAPNQPGVASPEGAVNAANQQAAPASTPQVIP